MINDFVGNDTKEIIISNYITLLLGVLTGFLLYLVPLSLHKDAAAIPNASVCRLTDGVVVLEDESPRLTI